MSAFLIHTESIFSCFFLLLTLLLSYSRKEELRRELPWLAGTLAVFALVYTPLEQFTDNLIVYILFLFIFGVGYSIRWSIQPLPARICLVVAYIYSIISCNALLSTLFPASSYNKSVHSVDAFQGTVQDLVRHYLFLYLLLALMAAFYSRYAIRDALNFPVRYWLALSVSTAISAAFVQILSYQYGYFSKTTPLYLLTLGLGLILMSYYISWLTVSIYQKNTAAAAINQRLELELKYLHHADAVIEQVRREKHELKNTFFYLRTLVESQNYLQLEEYLNTELGYRFQNMEEFRTGNHIVDLCLTQKVSEARKFGIPVMTDVLLPQTLALTDEELCSLLMNLLDNAIEASKKEPQPDLHISLRILQGYLQLQVKNRCSVNVLEHNQALHTTKADPLWHGIGLKIVRTITERHNGMIQNQYQDGYYRVTVLLDNSGCD